MGRKLILVGALAALSVFGSEVSLAQGSGQRSHSHGGMGRHNGQNQIRGGGQQHFFQLSPEERRSFQRNAERWLQMKPEQQSILREREQQRLQKMRMEAEAAMHQAGLRLDGAARDQFEARYLQERRRIERELRQEVEAKRQRELPQLNERLKSEFQPRQGGAASSVNPTSAPSASAKSRN